MYLSCLCILCMCKSSPVEEGAGDGGDFLLSGALRCARVIIRRLNVEMHTIVISCIYPPEWSAESFGRVVEVGGTRGEGMVEIITN